MLLDHLERALGELHSTTVVEEVGRLGSIGVLRFTDVPVAGAVTYVTFGLSRAELHVDPERHVRLELMLSLEDEEEPFAPTVWLVMLAEHFGDGGVAPRHAEVHRVGPLADGSALEGFALVPPVRFGGDFARLELPDDVPVDILELIPLSTVEAGFVRAHGWDEFVDVIRRNDPNLLDLRRPPLLERRPRAAGRPDEYVELDGSPVPRRRTGEG